MRQLFTLLLLVTAIKVIAQTPKVNIGSIQHIEKFPSKFVPARNVDIWLPDGYSPDKKYAVLYMHDGMALFDANIMWNKQEWSVDETMGRLLAEHKIKDCIVVGIWNGNADRHHEYFPEKVFNALPPHTRDSLYHIPAGNDKLFSARVNSEDYLKFIVNELKPYVDKHFSTLKGRANTFIAGSSMGGLISLYAICEYPRVFGGAACLSTHWTGTFTSGKNILPLIIIDYLSFRLPSPRNHKIYFDRGDQTLDALYAPYQPKVDSIMQSKGYIAGKNFLSKFYPGADHSENSWSKRLDVPLVFLLGR